MKCKHRTAFDSSRHLGSALRRSKGKPGAAVREYILAAHITPQHSQSKHSETAALANHKLT